MSAMTKDQIEKKLSEDTGEAITIEKHEGIWYWYMDKNPDLQDKIVDRCTHNCSLSQFDAVTLSGISREVEECQAQQGRGY
ncbi:MAG: hypothetical protein OEX12_08875 [Gammaproteobacteria bacterium]|nr:hypothetical protein [Gammaproteobacteria bacterium]